MLCLCFVLVGFVLGCLSCCFICFFVVVSLLCSCMLCFLVAVFAAVFSFLLFDCLHPKAHEQRTKSREQWGTLFHLHPKESHKEGRLVGSNKCYFKIIPGDDEGRRRRGFVPGDGFREGQRRFEAHEARENPLGRQADGRRLLAPRSRLSHESHIGVSASGSQARGIVDRATRVLGASRFPAN